MHKRTAALIIVALLLGIIPVTAGVVAEIDTEGRYQRTLVFTHASGKHLKIWNVKRLRTLYVPLNVEGDERGDLYPAILEDTSRNLKPWVVWSQSNGEDYDLVFSHWLNDDDQWAPVTTIESLPGFGDDLDPDLAFDPHDRPAAVWWSNELGIGQVYFTLKTNSGWMTKLRVSDVGIDSRYPQIKLQENGDLLVEYITPFGPEAKTVTIHEGVSINDDSDPIFNVTVRELQQNR